MGGNNSTQSGEQRFEGSGNYQVIHKAMPRQMMLPANYPRTETTGYDDMFNPGCQRLCVNKGALVHRPVGPTSLTECRGMVDFSNGEMNMDDVKALNWKPNLKTITRGKKCDNNVTKMARWQTNEFGHGSVNNTDSISRHVERGKSQYN